jgi:hypothetical protein
MTPARTTRSSRTYRTSHLSSNRLGS